MLDVVTRGAGEADTDIQTLAPAIHMYNGDMNRVKRAETCAHLHWHERKLYRVTSMPGALCEWAQPCPRAEV